ncbi:hypothetical protein NKR23_g10251 [Pleurostoma richardsiae]|uniref:Ankyrin repeat protein n=1 Tax=Pleurostoma richardsiae TaxID=41990 RepID=A0AA38VLW0_9PEZI|nr:hypothetical protein NKR23_g10251 [Pleurostoma richardsiae]
MVENEVRAFAGEINCELDRLIYSGHDKAVRHQKRHTAEIAREMTTTIDVIPEQSVQDCDWNALRELARKAIAEDDTALMREVVLSRNFEIDSVVDDHHGWNSLMLASYAGRKEQARLLLEAGADPDHRDLCRNSPLIIAAREEFREVLVELIRHGADTEQRDGRGYTAAMVAARFGNADVLEALLQKGADVDAALPNGRTALHIAAATGQPAIVCLLWKYGCRRDVRDKSGKTPLDLAKEENQHGAEKILLASLGEFEEFVELDGDSESSIERRKPRHGHLKDMFAGVI